MEITGIIEEVIFRNDENGYTIVKLGTEDGIVTCTGKFPIVAEGENLVITGDFKINPKYGNQFVAETVKVYEPTTKEQLIRYLSSGLISGVGPVTAKNIVDKFGDETLRIIESDAKRLAEIKGISPHKAVQISVAYNDIKTMQDAVIFLQKYDISINMSVKIYNKYKENTENVLKKNPYILVEDIDGVGFITADRIAARMGIGADSEFRMRAGLLYSLTVVAEKTGSTVILQDELFTEVCKLLNINAEVKRDAYDKVLVSLFIDGLATEYVVNEKNYVALTRYYTAERNIAAKLNRIISECVPFHADLAADIKEYERINKIELHDGQRQAIISAVNEGVVVITGGPGTGKTTIIRAIINIFESRGLKCMLVAPTGRAAKRLEESTYHPASTIHRALDLDYRGIARAFSYDDGTKLDADVIIVDEASMIDVMVASVLLKSVPGGARFILVGDKDQLPSVGAGNVLADIIKSGIIKVEELTHIYRQAGESMIVMNAHKINRGEMPVLSKKDGDFFYSGKAEPDAALAEILELVTERIPKFFDTESEKIQIITPMRAGLCGVENLNIKIQELVNPAAPAKNEKEVGKRTFRVGDKVMQTSNNYDQEWVKEKGLGLEFGKGVFNGDIGIITEVNVHTGETVVLFEDGRRALYSFIELEELVHAYAITIHKSQGSEFDVVIIPIMGGNPMLFNKNLLYTAVTRAKKLVVLIGSASKIYHMVKNEYIGKRETLLMDFLVKEKAKLDIIKNT